ncbi:DUF5641 domain-containing protein [Nephila pilipes]|uniref:DUF5641 domain-containing protein n=1 Tax=Nephila pilipes TaxID=299642 RepID=A0A8X6NWG3_NEPPI|nr:DUF5641 domain-containing protein [Nephila pilipes]
MPLVESCLPEETLMAWERKRSSETDAKGSRSLEHLMTFLRLEVQGDEMVQLAKSGFGTNIRKKDPPTERIKPNDLMTASALVSSENSAENRCSSTTDIDELNSRDFRKRMKYRIKLLSDLRQRFRKEYLSELIQKQNDNPVREPRVGEVVLIGDDNKKRLFWPIAKIIELIPGRDGEIRTVRLKTQHGSVIRPVQRIFPLEIQAIANNDKELKGESISVKCAKPENVLNTNDVIVKKYTSSGRLVKEPKRLDLLNYDCYSIFGEKIAICADTGASHTIADEKLFKFLQEHDIIFENKIISFMMADGIRQTITALSAVVNLYIEGKVIPIEFLVLPEAKGNKTLLGRDFLNAAGIVLDVQGEKWHFSKNLRKQYEFFKKPLEDIAISTFELRKDEEILYHQLIEKIDSLKVSDNKLLCVIDAKDIEKEVEQSEAYIVNLISYKCKITQKIAILTPPVVPPTFVNPNNVPSSTIDTVIQEPRSSIKLPKLTVNKFYGDHKNWLEFLSQFENAINKNSGLSKIEKLIYLKSLAGGCWERD